MTSSHVAGGGAAAAVAAVVVAVCNHFGWSVSDVDASLIGAAAVSAGVGFGHALEQGGVSGLFSFVWRGSKKPAAPQPPVSGV